MKKVGDTYKTNSILIAIIDINEENEPLKIVYKKLLTFRCKIGRFFVSVGEYLQGYKKPKFTYREKERYPWWK